MNARTQPPGSFPTATDSSVRLGAQTVWMVLMLALISGCTALQPPTADLSLIEDLKARAWAFESTGQPRKALATYRAVQAFDPGDTSVATQVSDLQSRLDNRSAHFLAQGRALLARGKTGQAREAFLKALAFKPDQKEALTGLREISRQNETVPFRLGPEGGDPRRIAGQIYGDPQKSIVVAYFLSSDNHSGTIALPSLDFQLKKEAEPEPPPEQSLARTRYAQSRGQNSTGPDVKNQGKRGSPSGTQNSTRTYEKAMVLKQKQEYLSALRLLASLSPDYRDVRKEMTEIRKRVDSEADRHYRAGLDHFLADDLKLAIREWERALLLNPGHNQAQQGLNRARGLLKVLETY